MALTISPMTAEELLVLTDDGFRYELIRGELRQKPPAGYDHGAFAMRLGWRLAQFVEIHDLGIISAAETGFLLAKNPATVLAPDVAFVSKDRVEEVGKIAGFGQGAPDLAAEVISPSDSYAEVEEKAMTWLSAGCRIVLILNPRQRTVTVFRSLQDIRLLTEEETLTIEDILPGWSVPVRDLFG